MGSQDLMPPGLAYLADNITGKDNILGASKEAGAKWAKGLNLPRQSETIFFAGCGYQYKNDLETMMSLIRKMDKSAIGSELTMSLAGFQKKLGIDAAGILRKVASRSDDSAAQPLKDAVKVLTGLGIKFGYLGEAEPCCGGLLHYIGMEKDFARHSQDVYSKLKSQGVKRIISVVPSCTYTLRQLTPASVPGYDIEVKHFVQVVAENISSRQWRFPREVKVAYHDPCQLARYLGIIEEPRRVLRAIKGITLAETQWTNGEWATCCGGGGGFEAVFPELSEILAVNRTKELLETGAQIIVTNCPGCIMQLESGLKALKVNNVEVMDLAQVVAMAMEG